MWLILIICVCVICNMCNMYVYVIICNNNIINNIIIYVCMWY